MKKFDKEYVNKEAIHIHNDVENLIYFKNKHGIYCSVDRITHYAMRGSDIVRVFYNKNEAQYFYDNQIKFLELEPIYFFDEEKFNLINNKKI